jgi:TRAF3-interacting protein 1
VIAGVSRVTGLGEELFEADEWTAAKIQGRAAKEAFLAKMIRCVEETNGEKLDVVPASMVAGKEPEQTNIFLQALARATMTPYVPTPEPVRPTAPDKKQKKKEKAPPKVKSPPRRRR